MTKREMYNAILEVVADNEEMVAFVNHEIELLDKKRTSARKPTKNQIENEAFKTDIVAYLSEVDAPKTIKELQAAIPSIANLTNQRITHLLTDLIKVQSIAKEYVKKTPYYFIAA